MDFNKIITTATIHEEIAEAKSIADCVISGMDLAVHMMTRDTNRVDPNDILEVLVKMDSDKSGMPFE